MSVHRSFAVSPHGESRRSHACSSDISRERTEPLAAIHHAITYRRILDALDPTERVEFTSALAWWVDKALESLSA